MANRPRRPAHNIFGTVLFVSLGLSAIFSLARMIAAPGALPEGADYEKVKSDYLLMLTQCLLGMVVMLLPSMIEKRWNLSIPHPVYLLYYIFLYCAVFLGEVFEFYYRVPHWDSILHFFSGAMLSALGFIVVDLLNRSEQVSVTLSPLFVSLFAFCFALALGAVWEIYEYACDGVMGLNMQKYADAQGVMKIGRASLHDTMKDLMVDASAALTMSVLGYFSIRKRQAEMAE